MDSTDDAGSVRARATYDAVAGEYAAQLGDELGGKPLDCALLAGFLELAATLTSDGDRLSRPYRAAGN